jgi:RNA polymerase sigma-70 factor (ECF subfamily)
MPRSSLLSSTAERNVCLIRSQIVSAEPRSGTCSASSGISVGSQVVYHRRDQKDESICDNQSGPLADPDPKSEVTGLLRRVSEGDADARERLFTMVYEELRRLARRAMKSERADHTLQATALVHEAFLRLADETCIKWEDRQHFFRVAAQTMRRILVDHARSLRASKRSGGHRTDLTPNLALSDQNVDDILAVDEALARLELLDARQIQVVELRYFAGFTNEETASVLGVNVRTVKRDWQLARAWLHSQLSADS